MANWATENMALRRDWLLQQLGITTWTLRRPTVLQGEVAVALPPSTRLLIIATPPPELADPLIRDVLSSLTLSTEQVAALTPEQAAMLPNTPRCHTWCLGTETALQVTGVQLTSPPLAVLYGNAAAKRALWQQMSEHLPRLAQAPTSCAE